MEAYYGFDGTGAEILYSPLRFYLKQTGKKIDIWFALGFLNYFDRVYSNKIKQLVTGKFVNEIHMPDSIFEELRNLMIKGDKEGLINKAREIIDLVRERTGCLEKIVD